MPLIQTNKDAERILGRIPSRGLVRWRDLRPILQAIVARLFVKLFLPGADMQEVKGGLQVRSRDGYGMGIVGDTGALQGHVYVDVGNGAVSHLLPGGTVGITTPSTNNVRVFYVVEEAYGQVVMEFATPGGEWQDTQLIGGAGRPGFVPINGSSSNNGIWSFRISDSRTQQLFQASLTFNS